MDALGAKPHGFNDPPTDRTVSEDVLNFSRIVALREEMVRSGDGKKAIWAVSWGWNTLPAGWTGAPSIWGSVTQQEQVQYTLDALDRVEREMPWIAGMTLQHWQPDAPSNDPLWGFALIDQDNRPTPLWTALAQRPPPSAAANGLYHPRTAYARYSGVWTFSDLGADIGWLPTSDSQLDFTFNGRDAALLLRKDDYVAYLYVTVDGNPANALPRDASGNSYIILTSGSLTPEVTLVPVARGLNAGQHTLHVTADRGWDRWALAGYAVSDGSLAAPYNQQLAIGWFTAAVTALAALVSSWRLDWRVPLQPVLLLWQRLSEAAQLIIGIVTSIALLMGMLLTWGDSVPHLFRRDSVQLGAAILTAGLVYLHPALVVTVVAAIVLFFVLYQRPDIGLTLTVFYAPFFLFPVELFRFAFPMAEIVILMTSTAWALRGLAAWGRNRQSHASQFPPESIRQYLKRWSALDYLVVIWLGLGFLSLLWAQRPPQAITELRTTMLEPTLFYVILRTTRPDRKTLVRLVDALLAAGLTVAVIGLVQYMQGQAVITAEEGARRLASVYGSPNNVGLFLGRCIPFALAFLLIRTDRVRWITALLILIVMAAAVALSQSVGAIFIGIPAAVVTVLLSARGRRAILPVLVLVIIGSVTFALAARSERFGRALDFTGGTNFFRIRVWQSSINLIEDHPLTGVGLDQFLYDFRDRYRMPDAESELNLSHPHNVILDFWVRLGILGVAVLLAIQYAFWKAARRARELVNRSDPLFFAVMVGAMGSMIDLLAHGLIDNSVYVLDLAIVFVLLLGLATCLSNIGAIDGGGH
jgi:O-antigen ligase